MRLAALRMIRRSFGRKGKGVLMRLAALLEFTPLLRFARAHGA